MSVIPGIPGLGLAQNEPTHSAAETTRRIDLQPFWEYRFEVGFGAPGITVKLVSGTAEKDGTELAHRNVYRFTATKSKILTLQGCVLEVDGQADEEWVFKDATPADNAANVHANMHFKLHDERVVAGQTGRHGPRVLVCGTPGSGKSTCARTLAAYARRMGDQVVVVNADPEEGMLTLAGTLSAAVYASMMDVENRSKWGSAPSSGPAHIPPKVPVVQFYGHRSPEDEPTLFRDAVSTLSGTVSARLSADPDVKRSGLIIDTAGVDPRNKASLALLAHIISEFSVNIVLAIDSSRLEEELRTMLADERTTLGEAITVVGINKAKELPARDETWSAQEREAEVKEYFFGSGDDVGGAADAAKRTLVVPVLSPYTQQVAFESLTIYRVVPREEAGSLFSMEARALERVDPDVDMLHWTLAVVQAAARDPPDTVRAAPVLGFVYVAEINDETAKLKLLGPLPGRLGDHPMIWGKWPEPNVNLLG